MKNSEILNGLSIEELQERSEFTAVPTEEGSCYHKCVFTPEPDDPTSL